MGVLRVRFSQSSERRGVFNYALKVEVVDAMGIPRKIFVYHQSPAGIDGNTFAEFDHIATPVDFQEIPENAASESVPWFRTDKCVIWFRSVSDMNLAKQMFVDDINALQRTYDVLTSENSFTRQTDVNFSKDGVHETDVNADPISEDIKAMKEDIVGKLSKDAMSGVELETNTAEGIRKAVQSIGNILGANIVKSIAIGFIVSACAMGQAFGAGFSGERFGDIDLDENPVVVTNVTFDGLATVSDIETNYYTKAETDDAIDAIAAYYITSDAQGSAFTNYLALTNAAAYYSGGVIRSPTRNDYAVVLADETHGGAEYRYIYAVPDGSTTGQWEAQYPIEINDYGQLSNKPSINGVTLSGNKTGADLGLAAQADATLTERGPNKDGFSAWDVLHTPLTAEQKAAFYAESPFAASGDYRVQIEEIAEVLYLYVGGYIAATVVISEDGLKATFDSSQSQEATTIWGPNGTTVATRTALQGYVLGSQTDKPLASEAEAEALRTGKQDKLTFDDIPTENSSNPVTSGGVYDETRINPVYDGNGQRFSDWVCVPETYNGAYITIEQTHSPEEGMAVYTPCTNGVAIGRAGTASEDVLSLRWRQGAASLIDLTATRTENKFIGYVLGSQTNKALASETEAEALRTNKLDKSAVVAPSTSATTGQAADAKATGDALAPLLFAQYYPDGSVTGASDFTQGIKYSFDTTNRTAFVKPFCNTGTAADDNSSLVGKVVIPPFVDAQGNRYISDDGTRFKVTAVASGGATASNPDLGAIVAPTTVTSIGDHAFAACTSLASVSLPAATSIGMYAFYGCTPLASVTLPAATSIGDYAFANCTSLPSVTLPAATSIGYRAFNNCTPLASVTLPAATNIGDHAFAACTSLASVSLPAATSIGMDAFNYCTSLASISLPAATSIGSYAFDGCTSLASVSLPAATSIGMYAFYGCTPLASVTLPAATSIGYRAFNGCTSLASVDFGATARSSVPTLGSNAFQNVPDTCKIIVPDAQYDAWIAASGWSTLYNNGNGYQFLKHSEWEYAHKYELAGKVSTTALTGETMPTNPTQNELAEAVKKIFTALGGTVTP